MHFEIHLLHNAPVHISHPQCGFLRSWWHHQTHGGSSTLGHLQSRSSCTSNLQMGITTYVRIPTRLWYFFIWVIGCLLKHLHCLSTAVELSHPSMERYTSYSSCTTSWFCMYCRNTLCKFHRSPEWLGQPPWLHSRSTVIYSASIQLYINNQFCCFLARMSTTYWIYFWYFLNCRLLVDSREFMLPDKKLSSLEKNVISWFLDTMALACSPNFRCTVWFDRRKV